MKKALLLIVAMLMLVCCFACSGEDSQVKAKLLGTWQYDYYSIIVKEHCHKSLTFSSDGTLVDIWVNDESPNKNSVKSGTYTINAEEIVAKYEDGDVQKYEYSYEDGVLRLFDLGNEFSHGS